MVLCVIMLAQHAFADEANKPGDTHFTRDDLCMYVMMMHPEWLRPPNGQPDILCAQDGCTTLTAPQTWASVCVVK
jgi:hypothetical protein